MANNVEQEIIFSGVASTLNGSPIDPINYRAQNFSGILAVATSPKLNEIAYARSSEGTKWLPGSLGGSYYPSGLYWYDGASWVSDKEAIAEQLQINVDDIDQLELNVASNDADIATLNSGLSAETAARIAADSALQSDIDSKVASVSGVLVDNTDPQNPVVNPITYTEESTIFAGDNSGIWVTRSLGAAYADKECEVMVYRSQTSAQWVGVRESGSVVPKYFRLGLGTCYFQVRADENGNIEIFSTTETATFEVTGTKPL